MEPKSVSAIPLMDDQSSFVSEETPKMRLIYLLDEVEKHADLLRRDLLLLEEKKDTLLATLDTIRNSDLITQLSADESSEVELYTDRLTKMCAAMDVKVITARDKRQEEALYQVNRLIDSLVVILQSDPRSAHTRCLSYVHSCSSHIRCKAIEIGKEDEEEVEDPSTSFIPDDIFEDAMFLCTPDDQKRIQRRLNGLLAYIERETTAVFSPTL